MMVIKESISRTRPDVVREVYRLLKQSAADAPAAKHPDALRFGTEAVRQSLETFIGYAERQGLLPRPFTVEKLFDEVTRSLD
jgi:4,5-dihydroxyphthalate decarboxylase